MGVVAVGVAVFFFFFYRSQEVLGLLMASTSGSRSWTNRISISQDMSEEGQAFYSEAPLNCPILDKTEKTPTLTYTLIPKQACVCVHMHTLMRGYPHSVDLSL